MTPKTREKVTTSSYMEEEYPNGVTIYTVYIGVTDPVFLSVYQDKVWGSGEDPVEALYDASKKWDSQHFPHLTGNPFRQVLESITLISSTSQVSGGSSPPRTRDDDIRHLDQHEEQLYGD